jgi:plastocyanin
VTTRLPATNNIRIIPQSRDYLDRKLGARGEVFYDQVDNTLRLYDGVQTGGIPLLRADLSNAEGIVGGAALGETPPTGSTIQSGTIWFNTANGRLYILYDDGNTTQWVQPATPSYGGGTGGGASVLDDLSDVSISSPTTGQVLKYNGTAWVNGTDNAGSYSLPTATTSVSGGVKVDGTTIVINGSGVISATGGGSGGYSLPTATVDILGGVKIDGTTITISSGVISSAQIFATLPDVVAAGITIDEIYLPAINKFIVTNRLAAAYLFDQYSGDNPQIYVITGTTVAFNLQCSGHPFQVQDPVGNNYNTGLVHVSTTGVVSTGSAAQGKTSGTLYWKIPDGISGGYRYQCSDHVGMVGSLVVKNIAGL